MSMSVCVRVSFLISANQEESKANAMSSNWFVISWLKMGKNGDYFCANCAICW